MMLVTQSSTIFAKVMSKSQDFQTKKEKIVAKCGILCKPQKGANSIPKNPSKPTHLIQECL